MTRSLITHIAPRLPPAIDGIGDYCRKLWENWPEAKPNWQFLVLKEAEKTKLHWPEVRVEQFEPLAALLAAALQRSEATTVILHYVGYGYHPRGIPRWLASGLAKWKKASATHRFVPMFHELYATGSIRQSAFWLQPMARFIIHKLVQSSDGWVTSCPDYVQRLQRDFGAVPARGKLIPIGSNIPTSAFIDFQRAWPLAQNGKLKVVIFGLPQTRLWTLQHHQNFLHALVQRGLVETITLLGKGDSSSSYTTELQDFQEFIGRPDLWQNHFDLSAAEISPILAHHDLGLVANEPGILTKSGVFAALSIHGVVSVAANKSRQTLSTPVQNCALLNTDHEADISLLAEHLRSAEQISRIKANLQTLAANELSWRSIARNWHAFLEQR